MNTQRKKCSACRRRRGGLSLKSIQIQPLLIMIKRAIWTTQSWDASFLAKSTRKLLLNILSDFQILWLCQKGMLGDICKVQVNQAARTHGPSCHFSRCHHRYAIHLPHLVTDQA